MSFYQDSIIKVTGCKKSEVNKVEDIMRNDIVHSTLDWLTKRQFNKAAKEAYEMFQYMNSAEGKAYIAEIEKQILAHA